MAQIQVTLVRSVIGRPVEQRRTVRALGLTRIRSTAVHDDTPSIRGMVRKVRHLVAVGAVAESAPAATAAADPAPVAETAAEEEEAE